jgi:hypothetical protein
VEPIHRRRRGEHHAREPGGDETQRLHESVQDPFAPHDDRPELDDRDPRLLPVEQPLGQHGRPHDRQRHDRRADLPQRVDRRRDDGEHGDGAQRRERRRAVEQQSEQGDEDDEQHPGARIQEGSGD